MLLLKTIVLLGALQGFIVSRLLWVSGRRRMEERLSRRLLALIIFLIALACLSLYLDHVSFWTDTIPGQILQAVIPLIIVMPIGPLIYFYVRSCEEPDFRLTRRYRRYFYPVVLDIFQCFAALLFVIGLFAGLITPNKYRFGIFQDDYNQYVDIPRWVSLTIYLQLATRYLRRRKAGVSGGAGNAEVAAMGLDDEEAVRRSAWLRVLLRVFWAFDLLWLAHLIPYELPKIGDELINRFDWYPLYIPLVIIIYFLGAKGYFISYRSSRPPVPDKKPSPITLAADKLDQLTLRLRRSMEHDRLWLNADLNLGKLAVHCGVSPKTLSTVLNQYMGVTFTDFVNQYRIDAVKERILLPESRRLTIAGLAYECGFNSLPTFQRAFKATTGVSPKEYMLRNSLSGI